MDSAAEKLFNAVTNNDVEASLNLLKEAEDACSLRDLAREASQFRKYGDRLDYSIELDGDRETLTVYHAKSAYAGNDRPIAAITNDACER